MAFPNPEVHPVIKTVFIPKENVRDLAEVQESVKEKLEIISIAHALEALPIAFKDWDKHIKKAKASKKIEK